MIHYLKRSKRTLLVTVMLLLAVVGAQVVAGASSSAPDHQSYKQQLKSQADDITGAPKSGHSPASLPQTSLANAAAQSVGNGKRATVPAAATVHGATVQPVKASDVLPDTKHTHMSVGGCNLVFGTSADKCFHQR